MIQEVMKSFLKLERFIVILFFFSLSGFALLDKDFNTFNNITSLDMIWIIPFSIVLGFFMKITCGAITIKIIEFERGKISSSGDFIITMIGMCIFLWCFLVTISYLSNNEINNIFKIMLTKDFIYLCNLFVVSFDLLRH